MRHHGRFIVSGFAGLTLSFSLNSIALAEAEIGRVALVNGDVKIARGENDPKARAARPNDVIYNLDIIKTGDNAAAKVLFTDQSVMDIGPGSALKVSDYALRDVESRTGTFSILYGKLRALVSKKVGPSGRVEVKSGDAVMGVRGTEFLVDAPKAGSTAGIGTQVVVVSGAVAVRPPAGGPAVMVGAGQMMVATPQSFAAAASAANAGGTAAAAAQGSEGKGDAKGDGVVMKVSAEQMQSMVSDVKAQDNTFMGSVTITPAAGGGNAQSPIAGNIGGLVAGMALPPPPSESGSAKPPAPLAVAVPVFLPPVNIVPGNQVHLTVNVQ